VPNSEADDALKLLDDFEAMQREWGPGEFPNAREPRPLSRDEYDQLRMQMNAPVVRGALRSPLERKQAEWAEDDKIIAEMRAEENKYREPITSDTLKGWGAEKWDRPEIAALQSEVDDRRASDVSRLSVAWGNVRANSSADFTSAWNWTRGKLGIQPPPPSQLQIDAGFNDAISSGDRLLGLYLKKLMRQLTQRPPQPRTADGRPLTDTPPADPGKSAPPIDLFTPKTATDAYARTASMIGLVPATSAPTPPPAPPPKQPPMSVPMWTASGHMLGDDTFAPAWQRDSGPK
jgi:hypothetical protein